MNQTARGAFPSDIRLTDFDLALERGSAGRIEPVVQGLRAAISADGLRLLTQELIDEARRRAPIGLTLKDVQVADNGVALVLRVEKSIFRSDLATRLVLSAPDGEALRVELADLEMPAWVPLDVLLDEAVKRGGGALRRDAGNRRALLLDPAALLTRFGVPGRFAPGHWAVQTSDDGITLVFGGGGAGA